MVKKEYKWSRVFTLVRVVLVLTSQIEHQLTRTKIFEGHQLVVEAHSSAVLPVLSSISAAVASKLDHPWS